jgi:hypothetical protein
MSIQATVNTRMVLLPSSWVTPLGHSWSFPQKKRIRFLKLLKFFEAAGSVFELLNLAVEA